jgi:mannose-1-phosphate guanylyltransferase/phosphomannomutase
VVWTKVATPALMAAALSEDVVLAASPDGGFIYPAFLPAYDAMAAFTKLLELLATTGTPLSKVVAGLPRVHIVHETVPTPWEQKGGVMRQLMEQSTGELVLIDGVKEHADDGWVLALPDPELPVTHVWAEAGSGGEARRRASEHVRRIRRLIRP